MSDMEAPDIIDELRGFAAGSESARASLMRDAADALEAAEKRAEENRKEIDRLSRELQVAEDQANTIAGDLAQAEQERDNWKLSAEEAERAEKRWERRVRIAEQERNQLADAVEEVRLYCENQGDKFRYHAGRILDMLASDPDDTLREHDAKVRAETLREFAGVVREIAALGPQNSGLRTPDQLAEYAANYADRIEREAGLK